MRARAPGSPPSAARRSSLARRRSCARSGRGGRSAMTTPFEACGSRCGPKEIVGTSVARVLRWTRSCPRTRWRPRAPNPDSTSAAVRRRVARVVESGELEQQLVQRVALLRLERSEELVLDPLPDRAQLGELFLAGRLQADEVSPPVGRVAPTLDQPVGLELVQQPDEPAAVVAERVGDGGLRLAGALVENREHRMVIRALARGLEGLDGAGLEGVAQALEQEGRARDELERRPDAELHEWARSGIRSGGCHVVQYSRVLGSKIAIVEFTNDTTRR